MSTRAGTALLALTTAGVLLTGCSAEDSSGPDAGPSASATAPAWNPCDGLDVARVGAVLGETLTLDRGTTEAPRCALVPQAEGGAVVDANYVVFPEGLDAAWEQMGAPDDGTVSVPRIPGADAARLVAVTGAEALGVTGFLQNGALVQVVNVVDTPPYDRKAAVAAAREVMTQLSAYAREGGAPQ